MITNAYGFFDAHISWEFCRSIFHRLNCQIPWQKGAWKRHAHIDLSMATAQRPWHRPQPETRYGRCFDWAPKRRTRRHAAGCHGLCNRVNAAGEIWDQ